MVGVINHDKTLSQTDYTGTITAFDSLGSTITIAATDIIKPSNWNSVHDIAITLSGNTSNLSTAASITNVVLAGGSNVTLSMATAGQAATITISGGIFGSDLRPNQLAQSTFVTLGQNSLYFQPIFPPNNVVASILQMPVSFSFTSSTNTRIYSLTLSACLYQIDIGANSTRITSLTSVSASFGVSRVSNSATYSININNSTSSSASSNLLLGAYILELPMATTFAAGGTYYLGLANSTASAGANSGMSMGFAALTNITSNYGEIAGGTVSQSAGSIYFDYDGLNYTSTSGAWPSAIPYISLSRAASGVVQYVEFVNS